MDNPDVMMYGAINSLRTGNLVVDMAVVFVVPYVFRYLLSFFQQVVPSIWRKIDKLFLRYHRRQIIHVQSGGYMPTKANHRNSILIHAIKQYIGHEIKTRYPVGSIKLTAISSKSSASRGSVAQQLEKLYKVLQLPQSGVFVEVEPGLWFTENERTESNEDRDEQKKDFKRPATIMTITLMANRRGGREKVDEFVERAYQWYVKRVEATEDHSRFMYQPLVVDKYASSEQKQKPRVYKRYKLSDEKTFKSLFFPEKDRLLHILDLFMNKKGKYTIKGFPHKLGLLLHGPPGTGKTSLVKAVAHLTGRHIISVPLSRINTNQELMDVMFDQLFNFKAIGDKKTSNDSDDEEDGGQATNNRLPFKEVIFLMEDVDAATSIVHSRKKKTISSGAQQLSTALERQYSIVNESSATTAELSIKERLEKKLEEQNELLKRQQALLDAANASRGKESGDKKSGTSGDGKEKKGDSAKDDKVKDIFAFEKDKLNLAGLLTVLDGIIDAPERILIMTTNHPEKLDAALLRPGRVNMQIYMGFIRPREAVEMAKHYYGGISAENEKKMFQLFEKLHSVVRGGFKMSPAEIEQKCAECDSFEELLAAIDAKGQEAARRL